MSGDMMSKGCVASELEDIKIWLREAGEHRKANMLDIAIGFLSRDENYIAGLKKTLLELMREKSVDQAFAKEPLKSLIANRAITPHRMMKIIPDELTEAAKEFRQLVGSLRPGCVIHSSPVQVGLELDDEQLERVDAVYGAVFECIKSLTENEDMEWDMHVVEEVTDSIIENLGEFGLRVRHPSVVENGDGTQQYQDYEPIADRQVSWPGPDDQMIKSEDFNCVWEAIRTWDINVPEAYVGYCGATGSHVRAILDALAISRQNSHEGIAPEINQLINRMREEFEIMSSSNVKQRAEATPSDAVPQTRKTLTPEAAIEALEEIRRNLFNDGDFINANAVYDAMLLLSKVKEGPDVKTRSAVD